jgi:hypothetical protein
VRSVSGLRRRGRRVYAPVLGLLALVVAAVVIAGPSTAAPTATPLHGNMRNIQNFGGPGCSSPVGVCSSFSATGSIKGDGVVTVLTFPSAEGLSQARTLITTKKGELHCHESALFDLTEASDHAFVDLCAIDGGTGDYAGASGCIQEVGTFDFANNVGQLDYYGKLIRG